MASNIKFKRSAVQNRVPTTAQLDLGELALNTYDGKLYTEINTGSAAVVEIGSKLSSLVVDGDNGAGGGDVTFHGTTANRDLVWDHSADRLILKDNTRIQLGDAATDLEMYHSGTNASITNNTGDFYLTNVAGNFFFLRSNNLQITRSDQSKTHAYFTTSAVVLNHDNSARVTTTADGADIGGTGSLKLPVGTTAQRNSSPASGDIRFNSTLGSFEGYSGAGWGELGGGGIGIGSTAVNPASGLVVNRIGVGFTDINVVGTGISVTGYGSTIVLDFNDFKPGSFNRSIHNYTATAGQTTFAGLSYDNAERQIAVYLNGARLSEATYTATSGTTVVLDVGASVGDEVEIINININSDVDRNVNTYTATAGQTTFTGLSYNSITELDVYLNGIRLATGDYTATTGNTVVLNVGASVNDIVDIVSTGDGVSFRSTADTSGDKFTLTNVGIGTDITPDKLNVRGNSSFVGVTTFTGNVFAQEKLSFGDSPYVGSTIPPNSLRFGDNDDLILYHTGSYSGIDERGGGTGGLVVHCTNNFTVKGNASNKNRIIAKEGGAVELYHNNSKKFETTSTGASITGNLAVSGVLTYDDVTNVDSVGIITARAGIVAQDDVTFQTANSNNLLFDKSDNSLKFGVNVKAKFGTGLEISHTGSGSVINDVGAGHLHLRVTNSNRLNITPNGVELCYNGTKTLETISNGIQVDGAATNLTIRSGTASGSAGGLINFKNVDANGVARDVARIKGFSDGTGGYGEITFQTAFNNSFNDVLRITKEQRLEIIGSSQYPVTIDGSDNGKIVLQGSSSPYIRFKEGSTDKAFIQWHSDGYLRLQNQEDAATLHIKDNFVFSPDNSNFYTIWHSGNDGSGSGLDADTLDGVQGASFLRSDANDTTTGIVNFTSSSIYPITINGSNNGKIVLQGSSNPFIRWREGSTDKAYIQFHSDGYFQITNQESNESIRIKSGSNGLKFLIDGTENDIWHAGNDGSGSGLDADTLDGQDGSYYRNASNLNAGTIDDARLPGTITSNITGNASQSDALKIVDTRNDGARVPNDYAAHKVTAEFTNQVINGWWSAITAKGWANGYAPWQLWGKSDVGQDINLYARFGHGQNNTWSSLYKIWHAGNDGSGSSLDADTLDGVQGSSYLRSDASDTASGQITLTSSSQYPLIINGSDDGKIVLQGASNPYIRFREGTTDKAYIQFHSNGTLYIVNQESGEQLFISSGSTGLKFHHDGTNSTVWHAGNDGTGSGLDADLWDGNQFASYLNQALLTSSTVSFTRVNVTGSHGISNDGWFRNSTSGEGLYNTATTQHFYSDDDDYWNVAGGGSANGIRFRDDHASTIRGYVYANNSNQVGFLNQSQAWSLRTETTGITKLGSRGYQIRDGNNSNNLYINSGTTGATGISMLNSNNEWRFQIYGDGSAYGFLDSNWGGWDIRKYINGQLKIRIDTGGTDHTVWCAGNDGSGSGLDADTVDGLHASSFVRNNQNSGYVLKFGSGSNTGHTASSLAYAIFQEGGTWTSPFPDLRINYHTGIVMAANASYGGIRFQRDYNDTTELMSIGNGDNHTRVAYNLQVSGDIQANGGAGAVTIGGNSDIRLTSGSWTGNAYGKIQHHSNYLYIAGGTAGIIFREDGTNRWLIEGSGHFIPGANDTYDIGSSSARVRNIYTQDLQLSNEAKKDTGGNDVDGTWGDWTLQEGEEEIFMINNRTGKKYAMMLREVA